MRQFTISLLLAAVACLLGSPTVGAADNGRRVQVAGIAFYNFENLFDTIPNNAEGRDEEFTPAGQRQWDGRKYRQKIHNLAYAISQFKTPTTPYGPALLGVSEIENRSVMEDVINQPELRDLNLRIVHHDSPDARGVDVGLIYNPRYFRVHNVTNHRLNAVPFRTRDQMCVVGSLLGQQIAVIVNHWPSRIGGQEQSEPNRVAAAELCMQIADSLWRVNPQMGVIIMGDLNDDPMDRSCAKVIGAERERRSRGARFLQSLVAHTRPRNRHSGIQKQLEPLRPDYRFRKPCKRTRQPLELLRGTRAQLRLPERHRRQPAGISQTHVLRRKLSRRIFRPLPYRNFPSPICREPCPITGLTSETIYITNL